MGAESIRLDREGPRGALLLHGFTDTPQSLRAMAESLYAAGWGVHAPLLPAHGRPREVFARQARAVDWIAAARQAWAELRSRYAAPVLMGQSMGGALSVILASEAPPTALVLFAPYLHMGRRARMVARLWPAATCIAPWIRGVPERGLRDPVARASSLGLGVSTPRTIAELRRVVDAARAVAFAVRVPVLVVQGRDDYRVPSRAVQSGFAALGSADKTLLWRDGVGHVVAADGDTDALATLVRQWLDSKV